MIGRAEHYHSSGFRNQFGLEIISYQYTAERMRYKMNSAGTTFLALADSVTYKTGQLFDASVS